MPDPFNQYLDAVNTGVARIRDDHDRIAEAAICLADCIAAGGIVHVFGSGHSAMLAQEIFHRAGGLVPINALLDVNLTIFGTAHATSLERQEGYAPAVFTNHDVRAGEVVIVISTSGVNSVPIEVALHAHALGASVIAVTSQRSYAGAESRHSSGRKLADVANIVLDTHVPHGDAVVPIDPEKTTIGALSTVLGGALLNALIVETARILHGRGISVPAFVSQNVPGGDEHNAALIAEYADRLPLMKP